MSQEKKIPDGRRDYMISTVLWILITLTLFCANRAGNETIESQQAAINTHKKKNEEANESLKKVSLELNEQSEKLKRLLLLHNELLNRAARKELTPPSLMSRDYPPFDGDPRGLVINHGVRYCQELQALVIAWQFHPVFAKLNREKNRGTTWRIKKIRLNRFDHLDEGTTELRIEQVQDVDGEDGEAWFSGYLILPKGKKFTGKIYAEQIDSQGLVLDRYELETTVVHQKPMRFSPR